MFEIVNNELINLTQGNVTFTELDYNNFRTMSSAEGTNNTKNMSKINNLYEITINKNEKGETNVEQIDQENKINPSFVKYNGRKDLTSTTSKEKSGKEKVFKNISHFYISVQKIDVNPCGRSEIEACG